MLKLLPGRPDGSREADPILQTCSNKQFAVPQGTPHVLKPKYFINRWSQHLGVTRSCVWLCLAPAWEVKLAKLGAGAEPGDGNSSAQNTRPHQPWPEGVCVFQRFWLRIPPGCGLGRAGSLPGPAGEPDLVSPRAGKLLRVALLCLLSGLLSVIGSAVLPLPPPSVALVVLGVGCAADPAWGRAGGWSLVRGCPCTAEHPCLHCLVSPATTS